MTALSDVATVLAAGAADISSQLLGSGLIGLREGLEAAIVVTILVAFLVRAQRRDALKWVWLGVAAAIVVTVGVFVAIRLGAGVITDRAAEAAGGIASLVAVGIVTTMVLWMKRAAAGLSGQLRDDLARALQTGAPAVLLLAFVAVGREGIETALFIAGYAKTDTVWPLVGVVLGALAAVAIAYGMYAGAVRINLGRFFTYTGVFLITVAAGILSSGIGALQRVGWLAGAGSRAFDAGGWSGWSTWFGAIVRGVFNITPTPTVAQFSGWLSYLVAVLVVFLWPRRRPTADPTASTPATPAH